jgi:hypothetical protein
MMEPQPAAPRDAAQQSILRLLGRVDRRLRLNHVLQALLLLVGLVLLVALAWRVLGVFNHAAPVAAAVTMLAAVMALIGVLLALGYRVAASAFGLQRAAAETDRRAGLRDEMLSALHFLGAQRNDWIDAQLDRAASHAASIAPSRLVPLRVPAGMLGSVIAGAIMVFLVGLISPLTPPARETAGEGPAALTDDERRQVQALQALIATAERSAAARKLEEALDALQRKDASDDEKRRALAQAEQAVEQSKLDAASTREGLYQLGQRLRNRQGMEEVAEALSQGAAGKAAELLERKAGRTAGEHAGAAADAAASQRAKKQELEKLLQEAAQAGGKGDEGPVPSSVAMKEAVDRLNKIASELEVQGSVSSSSRLLQQLQLSVAQRSTMSAGRFAQQSAQDSSPGPESGSTVMPGGRMFRSAAVAQESERSEQQEGSKSGDAQGESEADPLLGQKAKPLEVQLRQEALRQEGEPEEKSSDAWFYAESKEQKSALEARAVQARAGFAQAQTTSPEAISIRHRQIVKEYFMNLREGAK